MDVTLLGPSLLAFGELCNEANRVLNGADAKVKVLLHADLKANCVTLNFEIVQNAWEAGKALIENRNIHDAKELLGWVGILKGAAYAVCGGSGLIGYLRWKKNKKITGTQIKQTNHGNVVILNIEGDNNTVSVPQEIFNLSKSVKAVETAKLLAAPISEANGIEEAVFVHNGKPSLKIDQAYADDLQGVYADSEESEPQTFTAHIVVYSPVMDVKGKKWKFKFNDRIEQIDISGTNIIENAKKRGKVVWGDTYKVKLEMREHKTRSGDFKIDYKVKEVIEFRPGDEQTQTVFTLPVE